MTVVTLYKGTGNKTSKEDIVLGSTDAVFSSQGIANYDLNDKKQLDNAITDLLTSLQNLFKDMAIMTAYSPTDNEDLDQMLERTQIVFDLLVSDSQCLANLYFISRKITEGYKIKIDS